MKNAILKTKYVLLALVIAFTFSCSEDGAVGPQGPAGKDGQNGTNGVDGEDGPNGVDGQDGTNGVDGQDGTNGVDGQDGTNGIDGQDGTNGLDGNANVMASDWFKPSSYILSTGFGGINLLEHDQAAPEITQEIIDTGVVLVYGKLNGYISSVWPTDQVSLLPITLTYSVSPANIDTFTALLSVGNIKIRFINNNNTYSSLGTNHFFRYVVIPSSGSSSGRIADFSRKSLEDDLANAGVDINNYAEVLAYYGK